MTHEEKLALANKLLESGVAHRHHTYEKTGIIYVDLEGGYVAYLYPNAEGLDWFEIVNINNQKVASGIYSNENGTEKIVGLRNNISWKIIHKDYPEEIRTAIYKETGETLECHITIGKITLIDNAHHVFTYPSMAEVEERFFLI